MALNLYFLRHGQTALSRANHFCGSGSNPDLTEDGLEMAKAFAEQYQSHPWTSIYCSTLKRAVATTKPLADKLGLVPEQRSEIVEIDYGKWEGMSVDEAIRDFPEDHRKWNSDPSQFAPTGGETSIEIADRTMKLINEIREKYTEGNILLVSHKATIRIAIAKMMGMSLSEYRYRLNCPVASLSLVEFGKNGPLLSFLADRGHLPKRLRDLPGT